MDTRLLVVSELLIFSVFVQGGRWSQFIDIFKTPGAIDLILTMEVMFDKYYVN